MANAGMGMYEDPKKVRAQIKKERKQLKAEQKARRKEVKKREQEMDEREASLDLGGGGVASFVLTMMIVLMWLVIMALLVRLDVGGFGSNVLAPILKDVPYINRILPESARVQTTSVQTGADGQATGDGVNVNVDLTGYGNESDQGGYIRKLETELAQAQNKNRQDAETIEQLQAEVERLKSFEQEQVEFEAMKEQFYNDVIYNENAPDPAAYASYYEMIDPDSAAEIYERVVGGIASDEEVEQYAKTYAGMKPKESAALFDEMVSTGTEQQVLLAARIMLQMSSDERGAILGKMDAANAAVLTDILEPDALPYPDTSNN